MPTTPSKCRSAHAVGNAVEQAYRRGDMFEKRRKLMAAWAHICTSAPNRSGECRAVAGGGGSVVMSDENPWAQNRQNAVEYLRHQIFRRDLTAKRHQKRTGEVFDQTDDAITLPLDVARLVLDCAEAGKYKGQGKGGKLLSYFAGKRRDAVIVFGKGRKAELYEAAIHGIRKENGTYHARICVDGCRMDLGAFPTLKDAAAAYESAKKQSTPVLEGSGFLAIAFDGGVPPTMNECEDLAAEEARAFAWKRYGLNMAIKTIKNSMVGIACKIGSRPNIRRQPHLAPLNLTKLRDEPTVWWEER